MERPRLKANFAAEVAGDDRVFLLAENRHFLIQGRGPAAVVSYLDGRHTVSDIAQAVADRLSLTETLAAIRKFEAFGQLADGRPDLPDHEIAHWDARGIDPAAATTAIRDARISVVVMDDTATAPLLGALAADGFTPTLCDPREAAVSAADLTVVLVEDYLDPTLDRLDEALAPTGRRWLPAKASDRVLWLGPLMERGRTGCWVCLAQRLEANRQVERYVQGKVGDGRPARPAAHRAAGPIMLGGLLATELATIVATGQSANLDGKMLTFDLETLNADRHVLIRRPQCRRCGDPELIAGRDPKVAVASRPVRSDLDGGLRAESVGAVVDRLRKHVSPLIGAVTWLTTLNEIDNGMTYTYRAGHNFAMVGDNMNMLRRNLRGQSGGKGRTDLQAQASALGEAIERFSGVWRGDEPVRRAPFAELGPDAAIHPDRLLHFSPRQYEHRSSWNADPRHRLHIVPERLRADRPIDWTAGWSLVHDRIQYVPSAYAWFGHPDLNDEFFCYADSNGHAAGASREEAIVQGFCELAERDSVAIWWYNRIRRPALDLDALRDPYVDKLRSFYAELGRSLWVLDITTDLGVPAFAAVSHRLGHPVQDILIGFGAHLDAHMAAARALIEVNQFLPAAYERDAQGNTVYLEDDVAVLEWLRGAKIEEEPWLVPDPGLPSRTLSDYPGAAFTDLAEAVQCCLDRAAGADLDVVVVDQSQPDLDLNVVKVLAPGTRHFWRRLGPGRLYSVPARLGWLDQPRAEDAMNPKNVFF